ncbi:histidine phosphatase family protein [Virgibacillus alimentarius]|uniref:histidine phosphatase family protein n=1 Tax=Virgibacillus alimentarius TaxID=698769 RepID=UPI001CF75E3A|nr:histidine phosphatase family protein [Virgibacillus alimentarius]
MTSISLVRHGETDWNALEVVQGQMDTPLNERGIEQAKECANQLVKTKYDVLITSPLQRAKQTANIINEKLQIPLIEMEAFVERYYGEAQGMTKRERQAKYPDKDYPNQETRGALRKRVMAGLNEIIENNQGKHILLVAHGAVINTILATISNGKIGSGKTKLINACISNITFNQVEWRIQDYNIVSHLSAYCERSE